MLPVYPLNAEQIEIQNLARDFASREISPRARVCDSQSSIDNHLFEKICQSGLVNTRIPEEFAGLGLSLIDTCLIVEEFAFGCSGISSAAEASELAISYLLHFGSQDQKEQYLTILTKQSALAGIALPNHYANTNEHKLKAEERNGSIFINGYCPIVLNASFAKWFLISCPLIGKFQNQENEKKSSSLAYFIVPKDLKGLEVLNTVQLLGRKASDARAMQFDNLELDSTAKISTDSSSLSSAIAFADVLDIGLMSNAPIIASGCLGLAGAAFKHAKRYALERETFGVSISKHQSLAFMMADMATQIESVRTMTYDAIASFNSGAGNNLKIAISNISLALEMAASISNDAVQVFGAYGYTKDYPVEKLMRDAKTYQLFYENDQKEYLASSFMKS